MEQIRHINRCNTLQDRAVLTEDGSFCVPCLMETGIMKTRSERKGRHIQPLTDRRTTGQSWQTPLFGRQGRALRVSGKNHPRPEGLRYFSRKPCLSGSVCRNRRRHRYRYQCRYRQEESTIPRNRPSNSPHGKEADPYTSPRCWTRYWRYAAIPTGTGCWRSSSTDRKNTVIHTLIHTIMFFTAINQMMTEGVDLTLVIRKANGQLAVSTLPKSNGLKDEAQNHIVPLTVNGKPEELDAGFLQTVARPIQKAVGPRRRKRRRRGGRNTRNTSRKRRS